ncbi:MAG: lipoprotein signal peptidase [Verrucomicrobia bacterium]|nr:lipoprotein signal peptidase [Verrucomicrobiota bacterium]
MATGAPTPESTPAPPASGPQGLVAYRIFWIVAPAIVVLDQLSKLWLGARLPFGTYGEPGAIKVVSNFFYIVHVGNTGAAWSMFSGRSVLLALLAGATLFAIYLWRKALGLGDRATQFCFGLLCGGIAGNLIDRVRHGYVVDFIDLHFGSYVYPTFNLADAGICVGVVLYLIHSLRQPD